MSITRLELLSDAIWQRAWTITTLAELATFALTYTAPLGPKRGDFAFCVEDGNTYIFVGNNNYKRITGFASLPINLTSGVTGVLPTANGGNAVNIASAALPLGSGQIAFPSTQNPSSNPNTLDDYREGPWTPVITGAGGSSGTTFSTQSGSFTKIGRKVTCNFIVQFSNVGTITAGIRLTGLPFPANSENGVPQLVIHALLVDPWVQVYVVVNPSTSEALIRGMKVASTGNTLQLFQADLTNTCTFAGGLIYMT